MYLYTRSFLCPALGIRVRNTDSRRLSVSSSSSPPLLSLRSTKSTNYDISQTQAKTARSFLPCLHLKPRAMSSSKAPLAVHDSNPKDTFSYAEPDSADHPIGKRFLTTWADVRQEWQTGSRARVTGHFVVSTLVGFLIGWYIGLKSPGSGAAYRCP
jgi:hypothetical protein